MANPFDTLRKLRGRSFKEIRVRGEQAIAVSAERIGLSGKLPSNSEFESLIDRDRFFGGVNPSAEMLMAAFYEQGEASFFQSFADREKTVKTFREQFGGTRLSTVSILDKAERIIEGRFDLLGYENLDFGGEHVDWHFEPVAGKNIPLRHWKQFDELSTRETGDKKIVWELNRHQHFFTLGAAYWLSGDERYAETFARHLDEWIMQNPPGMGVNWMSSLEVAFRAMSWVWAFRFFKNSPSLTPTLFHNGLRYLFLHGRHIEKYLSTYYSPNTHLTGEALGLYYLGTQFRFFTRSSHWRDLGARILLDEMERQVYPDGAYFEQSTWYQRYTADFYTQFFILRSLDEKIESASETAGGADGKTETEKLSGSLQRQLDLLMHVTRPDGTTPLVGDDDGGRSLPHGGGELEPNDFRYILSTGAVLFSRPDYKFVARDFGEETLWLLGAQSVAAFDRLTAARPLQTSRGFPSGGYFVMRDGWDSTDNYLLIDGGNMGALSAGHSHADSLAIDCAAGGKTLLVDPGTYTYHESEHFRDYFRSTMAHNTLSVGNQSSSEPGGKFSWQTTAKTDVRGWIAEDRFDFFEASHDGYERLTEAPVKHARSVLFLKNDYWIIRDFAEIAGSGAAENSYQLNFHFKDDTDPVVQDAVNGGGDAFVKEVSSRRVGLRLFTFGDNGAWHRKQSWIAPCYGRRVAAPFLRFLSRGVGAQEFFTFLLPVDAAFTVEPLVAETNMIGGRAFSIDYRNYRDLFVFGDGDSVLEGEFFESDFRFLWARLSPGETVAEEFVLVDGTRFVLDGKEVVNQPEDKRLEFASGRRLGNLLNVRTPGRIFQLSL